MRRTSKRRWGKKRERNVQKEKKERSKYRKKRCEKIKLKKKNSRETCEILSKIYTKKKL